MYKIVMPCIPEKEELTKQALESLKKYTPEDVEIILLMDKDKNGFIWNMNQLLKDTNDDIIIFHMDMIANEGWLDRFLKYVNETDAGIIGSVLLYPSGLIQHAGGFIRGDFLAGNLGAGEIDFGQYDSVRKVPFVTFGCVYIRNEVIKKLGTLDENLRPMYFDDVDYCLRAWEEGFKVVCVPTKIIHFESMTTRDNPKTKEMWVKNRDYMIAKYLNKLDDIKIKIRGANEI